MKKNIQLLTSALIATLPTLVLADTVIDDFSTGATHIVSSGWPNGGHSVFDYYEDAAVAGGAREVMTLDAYSGKFGGRSHLKVDTSGAGTLSLWGVGYTVCDSRVMYGTAIGTQDKPWSQSPNKGKGVDMNIYAGLDSEILIDIGQLATYVDNSQSAHVQVGIFADGRQFVGGGHYTATGVVGVALNGMSGPWGPITNFYNEGDEIDIDGMVFSNYACTRNGESQATVLNSFAIGGGDSDGDGVPDADDVCPNTNLGAAVTIGDLDSGIDNRFNPETGCSTADLVDEVVQDCSVGASNHGQFVSCFAKGANSLKAIGVITGKEKGALQSAAAQSDLP